MVKPPANPSKPSHYRRVLLRCALVLLASALAVWGIVAGGDLARGLLGGQDRYRFEFGTIECRVPVGMERSQFLVEVQYLSGIPERLSILDPNLSETLMLAFSRHPRVESVGEVRIASRTNVSIELKFVPDSGAKAQSKP